MTELSLQIRKGTLILHGAKFPIEDSGAKWNYKSDSIECSLNLSSKSNLWRFFKVARDRVPIYAQLITERTHLYFIFGPQDFTVIESVDTASIRISGTKVVGYGR